MVVSRGLEGAGTDALLAYFARPELNQEIINLGARVIGSIIDWPDWMHRKIESLDLLPRERGRRRVSVDCTPPRLQWQDVHGPESGGIASTLVPLTLMAKRPLQGFDIVDADGRPIPILGSASNGLLAAAAISFLVWMTLEKDLVKVQSLWPRICDVAVNSSALASLQAEKLLTELNLSGIATLVIRDLAECFLLIAVLPAESAGVRQVIKYSYHWETGDRASWFARTLNVTVAGLGLRRFTMSVDIGATDTARSYHLECLPPEGLVSAGMELPIDGSGHLQESVRASQVSHAIGHYPLYQTPGTQTAVVKFNLDSVGLIARVFWASVATFALFGVMVWVPGVYRTLSSSVDAATALFLFVPALLVALNVRGRENVIVGRLLLPLRTVTIMLSLMLFLGGGLLVLKVPESLTESLWWVFLGLSGFSTVVTAVGLIRLKVMGRG